MTVTEPPDVLYGDGVADLAGDTPGRRFGRLIREARLRKGWTQDDVVARSDVSMPTLRRWEAGNAERPEPDLVRSVTRALDIDAREAPVALGYVTREEMGLPPEPPRQFDLNLEQLIAIFEDPEVPASVKEEVRQFALFRTRPAEEPERPARRRAAG